MFVIPDGKDPSKVIAVMSDELAPDENVPIEKIKGLTLTCRDAGGKDVPVSLAVGKHELTAAIPGSGPRVVFGSVNYGVMQKGEGKMYLLAYHPKAVVGAVAADKLVIGEKAVPAEIVPVAVGSEVRFQFRAAGKAVTDAEVTVIGPDGKSAKAKTDATGHTPGFPATGRYGAWAKHIVPTAGEHGGKKYEEARHYATLVVDLSAK
ncbi:DUF4198 domain-containing protein [bacterium]|nr:DUF4198 domain-containing protein [bacterium]